MIHLHSIVVERARGLQAGAYPFTVPAVKSINELVFPTEVTFLVGENGSGKSTLLEAIAVSAGSITVGTESVGTDPSLAAIRLLAKRTKLVWNRRTHAGFFMRSEDFFGYAKRQNSLRDELRADLARAEEATKHRDTTARNMARLPYLKELGDMRRRYGESLDAGSHGESYFTLFRSRFVPNGLYLLDEPEAPLSPLRQLSLISMLKEMVDTGNAQFIIATHSPILMAFPGATIYSFDGGSPQRVPYDELEHVRLTKSFLSDPEQFLRHL